MQLLLINGAAGAGRLISVEGWAFFAGARRCRLLDAAGLVQYVTVIGARRNQRLLLLLLLLLVVLLELPAVSHVHWWKQMMRMRMRMTAARCRCGRSQRNMLLVEFNAGWACCCYCCCCWWLMIKMLLCRRRRIEWARINELRLMIEMMGMMMIQVVGMMMVVVAAGAVEIVAKMIVNIDCGRTRLLLVMMMMLLLLMLLVMMIVEV